MEEKKKNNKKMDIFYIAVLVLSLLIMIAGATLAYFSATVTQPDEATQIYSGTLIINYIDGELINNPPLTPRYAPSGINDTNNVYTNSFGVESAGTLNQNISIDFDVIENQFSNNNLKYAIYSKETGEKITTGAIPTSGKLQMVSNQYLEHGTTANYILMIWLEENNMNQDYEQGHAFSGKITINAVQAR